MAQNWSFVSAGVAANGSNPTVTIPTGYRAGSSFLLFAVNNNSATPTLPSGWDLIFSASGTATATERQFVYHRITTASESNVSVTITAATSSIAILCYDEVLSFQRSNNSTSSNITPVQNVVGDTLLISFWYGGGGNFGAAPAGTTQRFNDAFFVADEFFAGGGGGTNTTSRILGRSASNPDMAASIAFNQTNGGFRMF